MAGSDAPANGNWGRLARRLDLALVRGGGLFSRRRRRLVGIRNGYLVSVTPSRSLNEESVDLLVRFPQRSTVREMREDMLKDPALVAAFGRKRRVPRSRQKYLQVGDGVVLMRLAYRVFPPRAATVERVLDGLIEALKPRIR